MSSRSSTVPLSVRTSKDLKTTACSVPGTMPAPIREAMRLVPAEVNEKFFGCGMTIPLGIEGRCVLDLGSGSWRDAYIAAQLVGSTGYVTGIDMTKEQVDIAQRNTAAFVSTVGYNNIEFVQGYVEKLEEAGIAEDSTDIAISNCVINLCPDKPKVLQGVFKALKEGGEFYFSDMYCDRRLSDTVKAQEVLYGEGIAGALYVKDFLRIARDAGFTDPRIIARSNIAVTDPEIKELIGDAKFESITFRLFKLHNLEAPSPEDYGQVVVYNGGIAGHSDVYVLDDHFQFKTGTSVHVCGNTATILSESWLSKYFTVSGDRSVHYGPFLRTASAGVCNSGRC